MHKRGVSCTKCPFCELFFKFRTRKLTFPHFRDENCKIVEFRETKRVGKGVFRVRLSSGFNFLFQKLSDWYSSLNRDYDKLII